MLPTTKGYGDPKKGKIAVDQDSLGKLYGEDKNEMSVEAYLNVGIWRGRERHWEGGEPHWMVVECYSFVCFLLLRIFVPLFLVLMLFFLLLKCLFPNSQGPGGVANSHILNSTFPPKDLVWA